MSVTTIQRSLVTSIKSAIAEYYGPDKIWHVIHWIDYGMREDRTGARENQSVLVSVRSDEELTFLHLLDADIISDAAEPSRSNPCVWRLSWRETVPF